MQIGIFNNPVETLPPHKKSRIIRVQQNIVTRRSAALYCAAKWDFAVVRRVSLYQTKFTCLVFYNNSFAFFNSHCPEGTATPNRMISLGVDQTFGFRRSFHSRTIRTCDNRYISMINMSIINCIILANRWGGISDLSITILKQPTPML